MSSIGQLQDVLNASAASVDSVEPLDMTLWATYQHLTPPQATGPQVDKRFKVAAILLGVIIAWWMLGKLHPQVRKAHRTVAPNVAGTAVTQAAVGAA